MRPYVLNEYQRIRNDLITRLVIFLTYRCNFNCSYCYVNKKETKELSANKLIKIIKELKTKNNEIKEINFMGGEPLLRFDVIKEIINIFGNEFVFNLNTNGYLLDKETLDFLLKNNVIIVLSLDGSEKTHNLNRKDKTFNKILNNIKGYEDKVIVNYVINPNSIDNLIKDFENLVNLGFKKIDVRPNSDYLWRKDEFPQNNFDDKAHFGLIAQDVEKIVPELVTTGPDGYKGIDYNGLAPLLIGSTQELQRIIMNQQNEIEELKARVSDLENKMLK